MLGEETIEQQLAAAKAVANIHASLASLTGGETGEQVEVREGEQSTGETSQEGTSYMMEESSKVSIYLAAYLFVRYGLILIL